MPAGPPQSALELSTFLKNWFRIGEILYNKKLDMITPVIIAIKHLFFISEKSKKK